MEKPTPESTNQLNFEIPSLFNMCRLKLARQDALSIPTTTGVNLLSLSKKINSESIEAFLNRCPSTPLKSTTNILQWIYSFFYSTNVNVNAEINETRENTIEAELNGIPSQYHSLLVHIAAIKEKKSNFKNYVFNILKKIEDKDEAEVDQYKKEYLISLRIAFNCNKQQFYNKILIHDEKINLKSFVLSPASDPKTIFQQLERNVRQHPFNLIINRQFPQVVKFYIIKNNYTPEEITRIILSYCKRMISNFDIQKLKIIHCPSGKLFLNMPNKEQLRIDSDTIQCFYSP